MTCKHKSTDERTLLDSPLQDYLWKHCDCSSDQIEKIERFLRSELGAMKKNTHNGICNCVVCSSNGAYNKILDEAIAKLCGGGK